MTAVLESTKSITRAARPLRVLLVDDSEADVESIERMLRREYGAGIEIASVDSAADAGSLLARRTFDVALVDYRLPDRDGLELIAEIASQGRAATILLTGQGNESVAARAIKRGAKDYLVKRDLSPAHLRKVISEALSEAPAGAGQQWFLHGAEKLRHDRAELDNGLRTLSHDMTATFLVLENSFERLRSSAGELRLDEVVEGMTHVEACMRQSKQFVDDLRSLAKTGAMEMAPARVELSTIVEETRLELAPQLAERRAELHIATRLPAIWCHETRARQIISNLVRNALIHGCDAREPRITIATRDRGAGYVWLWVHDNGPGVPAARREEIFLPGRRLNTSVPGTGMGLAIVKKIVTHYGGEIMLDTATNSGAAFLLSLPAARD